MTDTPPTIAHRDDIDRELAERAFSGTSFSPEQRGQARREDYANAVNGLYSELWPLAETEDQRTLLAAEMERYRQGFINHLNNYLASHSRVVSSFIAGPSQFPAARMQQRGQRADNKAHELLEWDQRARAAIKQKLLDARPEEEKEAQRWRDISYDISGSLSSILAIDVGHQPFTRSAFVNSIAGKVERLALAGDVAMVEKALELVRSFNAQHDKPAISERHQFWTFGELARQRAAQAETVASQEPTVPAHTEGIDIISNHHLDRVQIVFAPKPSIEIIGKLKAEGWHWSRHEGAWQRKLTQAALASAQRITGLGGGV